MEIRFQIKEGLVYFGGRVATMRALEILKKHEGKYGKLTVDDRESAQMRRFFDGAVVRYWFFQNPHAGWKTFEDARDNLKLRWNPRHTTDQDGKFVTVPGSTMMSRKRFAAMLETMNKDWAEEAYEYPDPEAYKLWQDSAPAPDAVYPPLQALIDKYHHERGD
jgi:hypothetical protein